MVKRKDKIVWSKIFSGNFKKGDYVHFNKGKHIWEITFRSDYGVNLHCLNQWSRMYLRTRELHRIYKIEKEDVMLFLARNKPRYFFKKFSDEEIVEFLRRHLPKPQI